MRKPLFPRNITARADYAVDGNPASSRPHNAVDNCFPGLDCDSRNLESKFLRGLIFEFQRGEGALLAGLELTPEQARSGLTAADLTSGTLQVFLWALYGRLRIEDPEPVLIGCNQLTGIDVWRYVRLLVAGRVAIAFGPGAGFQNSAAPIALARELRNAYHAETVAEQYVVTRDSGGTLDHAVFSQDRTSYLDEDGVIDSLFEPGFLTKTLCNPWIYDFRDCNCHYWAASKPDVVASADGKVPYLDFLRDRDRFPDDEQVPDVDMDPETRRKRQYDHKTLIEGAWRRLPAVLNDREIRELPAVAEPIPNPISEHDLIKVLTYLASVEHGLMAEYLFAYYSVNAPQRLTPQASNKEKALFDAARQIRRVAFDEMQHFLWVNRILKLLGQPPSLKRATEIDISKTGVHLPINLVKREIRLRRLDAEVLREFIDVESVSRSFSPSSQSFSGMYVFLMESVKSPNFQLSQTLAGSQPDNVRDRIATVFKLLIDEGDAHFRRFRAVQDNLCKEIPNSEKWSRTLDEKPSPESRKLEADLKGVYSTIMEALAESFQGGPDVEGHKLREAMRMMPHLNRIAFALAETNVRFRFDSLEHDGY